MLLVWVRSYNCPNPTRAVPTSLATMGMLTLLDRRGIVSAMPLKVVAKR